jgi:GDPmannose 4,6-dehydratase
MASASAPPAGSEGVDAGACRPAFERAIVVGSRGQDGAILSRRLEADGVAVVGVDVGAVSGPAVLELPTEVDLRDRRAVAALVERVRPDALFYLAAYHRSSEQAADSDVALAFQTSLDVHVRGAVNALEAIRTLQPRCRLFYAASSHVFGNPPSNRQDESTPIAPRCVYGITKAAGLQACRFYREAHGVFATVGILYNHESPKRAPGFVSQRIVRGALAARDAVEKNLPYALRLGNLSAVVDWGWAEDYIDAMVRALSLPAAEDFVIASGEPHTVRDFAAAAFGAVGLDWSRYVEEDPSLLKKQTATLVGDASKLRRLTGWGPSLTFERMVERLVREAEV